MHKGHDGEQLTYDTGTGMATACSTDPIAGKAVQSQRGSETGEEQD